MLGQLRRHLKTKLEPNFLPPAKVNFNIKAKHKNILQEKYRSKINV